MSVDAALEALIRRVVREELASAGLASFPAVRQADPSTGIGGITQPQAGWEGIPEARIVSGSKTYTIRPGYPVKVEGLGRGGAAQAGWTIEKITRRGDKVNVDCHNPKGRPQSRTFPLDKLRYQRPRGGK